MYRTGIQRISMAKLIGEPDGISQIWYAILSAFKLGDSEQQLFLHYLFYVDPLDHIQIFGSMDVVGCLSIIWMLQLDMPDEV